ncbi:MAG TPA: BTAD domain-containing putative transcriptional regulator, partial [Gemmatimonadales bacterium]|nr:BTAD domain-containing putative transcriptional regulator [Gemmatimonadales bacterium]
ALYGGAFLDGFLVAGLGEFVEWAEGERRRLARRRSEALEELAERAARHGAYAAAVRWHRLLAEADPLSAAAALGLMRALERAGDRAAALEHARQYAAELDAELGVGVDPEVEEFVERLRRPAASGSPAPRPRESAGRLSPRPAGAVATMVATAPAPTLRRPRSVASVVLPLAIAVVLATLATAVRSDHRSPPLPDGPARMTVLPFETLGDGQDSEVGRGFDALLGSAMGGLDGYRLVPAPALTRGASMPSAAAKRVGARYYVTGRLIVSSAGLRAVATVHDRANGDQEVGHSEGEVGRGELVALADQIARGLITDLYREPGQEMARAGVTATRSLPALKAYLEGERALREEDYSAARDAFRRATRADTAFALAYYRCSFAADRAGEDETAGWAATMATQFSERLSEHDRRLVTAYLVGRRGMLDEAERLYHGVLADYPHDTEAWLELGELLVRGNPLRGRSIREARPAFEQVLAANPDQGDALAHLAGIAALEGRPAEADSLLRRAETTAPRPHALELRLVRAFALNDRPGAARASRDLLAQPWLVPSRLALSMAGRLDDLNSAERFAQTLTHAPGTCDVRALGHRMLALVAMAQGRARLFHRELGQAAPCDPGATLELRALMAAQPFTAPSAAELTELAEDLRSAADSVLGWPARSYYAGLVALRQGDTLAAARGARILLRSSDTTAQGNVARTLGRSLRARLRLAAHRPADALAQIQAAGWERSAKLTIAEASDRFFRAELLHLLGRDEEAIGWYQSIAERASYELVYLAPAQSRLAGIYEARGDTASAAARYRRVVELWREADPELRGPVEEAERRLAIR